MYSCFVNALTPPKTNIKPEKHPCEEENRLNQASILGFFSVRFLGPNTPPGPIFDSLCCLWLSQLQSGPHSRLKHSNLVRKCISTCLAVGNVPRFSDFCWSKICGRPQLWVGGRIPAKRRTFTEALRVRIGFESGSWLISLNSSFSGSSQRKWNRQLRHQTYTPESWFPRTSKFQVEVGTWRGHEPWHYPWWCQSCSTTWWLVEVAWLTPKANYPASWGLFKQTMISNEVCNENNNTYQNHSKSPGVCQKS